MSFEEALAARTEFRRRQRERRERGGLRNRRQQRRGDDDKKAEGVDGDETPDDKDEPPSEDDKTKSSTQTKSTSQQQTSQQVTQLATVTSIASQSSSPASATRKGVEPAASVTNTVWTTSVVVITSVASPGTTAPLAITTAQGSAASITTSRQASSTTETGKKAAQTTGGSGISSTHESNVSKSSNADTILFAVIGTIAGIALLGAIAFYIYRRVTKPKVSHDLREANAYQAPSIWGGNGSGSVVSDSRSRASMAFVPPITVGRNQNQVGTFNRPAGSVADREERLARVRTDLLSSRELQMGSSLNPGLMGGRGVQNGSGLRNVQTYEEEKEMASPEDPFQEVEVESRSNFSWEAPKPVMLRQSTVESEASLPQWRDPVAWARDQARRNEMRGADAPVEKDYHP